MRRNPFARHARRCASFCRIMLSLIVFAMPLTAQTVRVSEFEDRRKIGIGRYLTADTFERDLDRSFSDVLIRLPGVRTMSDGGQRVLMSTRDGGKPCRLHIFLNGAPMGGFVGQVDFDVNTVSTREVLGVEYYTVSTTPPKYATSVKPGIEACGTMLIWTK